jgi:mono/diheme cytochrome c family protein
MRHSKLSAALGLILFACSDADYAPPVSTSPEDRVTRGQYLVDHVSGCGDCHTPRGAMGAPLQDQYLAGAECFVRLDDGSCLHSSNLTNHETGLANLSDAEIARMIKDGVRPSATGDEALFPVMASFVYHNLRDDDLAAIVAYLRTVPGVQHAVPRRDADFDIPGPDALASLAPTRFGARRGALAPAVALAASMIPMPMPGYPQPEAALRGRYLATAAGACLVCHSRHVDPEPEWLDYDGLFAGGEEFAVGLPTFSYAGNITSDPETGIGDWSLDDIVTVIKQGSDPDGDGICPPMPAGPMAAFAGMTDEDALDIAHYIKSLPPIVDATEHACQFPPL